MPRRRAPALACLGAQDGGAWSPPRPWREGAGEESPAQGRGSNARPPRRRVLAGPPREASLAAEMGQGSPPRRRPQALWSAGVALGAAGTSGPLSLWGFGGQPRPWPRVDHRGTSRFPRRSLAWQGAQTRAPPAGAGTARRDG